MLQRCVAREDAPPEPTVQRDEFKDFVEARSEPYPAVHPRLEEVRQEVYASEFVRGLIAVHL
jgi:hypothetical protein